MNPHAEKSISPLSLWHSIWSNKQLIVEMTKREVLGRYKGSAAGVLWSFINPVMMLAIYTFVFSGVFKARWGNDAGGETKIEFALILFVGMIVHGFFTEVLLRAPSLISGNINYVKKIIFPLEILPIISVGAALFHALISMCVLLLAYIILNGQATWTAVFIPLVFLPLIILMLGLTWILASLGVFLRDITQTIGVVTTIMLFSAPVFYPISILPQNIQFWIRLNPLTMIIEQSRIVLIFGGTPNWSGLLIYTFTSILVGWLGYAWFQKTRRGFANVL